MEYLQALELQDADLNIALQTGTVGQAEIPHLTFKHYYSSGMCCFFLLLLLSIALSIDTLYLTVTGNSDMVT